MPTLRWTHERRGWLTIAALDRIGSVRGYSMGEKNWGCFKQAAVGCGCLLVLAVAVPVVLAVMIMLPLNRAVENRTELEDRFGTQDAFVPPAAGIPSPDRVEAFLRVRQSLTSTCDDFWNAERAVAAMEAFDDQEEVSKIAVMKQAMSTSKTMMGMGPLIGHFYEIRNQALVDEGMGLGEYTYIYVLAYNDEIVNPSEKLELFGPGATNLRVREALLSMLRNQLELLQKECGLPDVADAVAAEVEAMEQDAKRIPWQDGLPPAIEDSLLPYRAELDRLFCGSTPPLELMINEKRGLAIESR